MPTQHPVEQFAGTSAKLPPMMNRRPPKKNEMVGNKIIFQINTTCNYQKSHFECQGKNNCEYLFKFETKESPVTGRQIHYAGAKKIDDFCAFQCLFFY